MVNGVATNPLYFETVFVDPASTGIPVMILPGNSVFVRTTGNDPVGGQFKDVRKCVPVYDVRAWTSYQQDSVTVVAILPKHRQARRSR